MIEMMAEAVGVTPKAMVIGLICFAIAFVIIFIKLKLDEKKGINSQEKEDIRKLVNNLVPGIRRRTPTAQNPLWGRKFTITMR